MCAKTLKTVLTALEVLEILEQEEGIGPTKLAEQLDVTRPTAYGYLSTLAEAGYARKDSGEYYLSYRILGIGNRLKYREPLFRASKVPLRKLVSEIREPAFIGIEEAGEWVVLHRNGDISSIDIRTYSGLRLPLHTHAAGKIMLAEMGPERRDEVLESRGLHAMTDETLTERPELESELRRIREQGYAVDWDEQARGVGTAARPISGDEGFLGTISVATLTSTLQNRDDRDAILQKLKETAEEIIVNYRHL
ncbi:IclR family transcriptional regulator [Haloferax sp. KTX1]|uniref:IclR family transcriptional regulator n=1 Tax=Haloferax sp. KTX1 TaxID=2600597 RepID=UPI001651B52B|nr:IclR family transcriptional regulator [Haloferax sp. KTX1]